MIYSIKDTYSLKDQDIIDNGGYFYNLEDQAMTDDIGVFYNLACGVWIQSMLHCNAR